MKRCLTICLTLALLLSCAPVLSAEDPQSIPGSAGAIAERQQAVGEPAEVSDVVIPTDGTPLPIVAELENQSNTGAFNRNYTLTGNPVSDMIAVASAQVGRNNMGYTEGWCDNFISDCAILAGQAAAVPQAGNVNHFYTALINAGGTVVASPQAGDVILYYSSNDWAYHCGLMVDASNNIEGNIWVDGVTSVTNSYVYRQSTRWNSASSYKVVYVRPNYQTTPTAYTNYVNHWAWGFKNGEGNNWDKSGFNLGQTSWTAQQGTTQTYDASRQKTIRGFLAKPAMGSGDFSGAWTDYALPYTFTQPAKDTSAEFDYEPIQYSIKYDTDGGTNGAGNPSTYTVLYGVTFAAPTKTGYTFNGWRDENGNTVTGINPGANAAFASADAFYSAVNSRTIGNKTVTAQWTANTYTVTFDPKSGSVDPSGKTIAYGAEYGDLPTPTRAGYAFDGWYTEASGGTQIFCDTKVTAAEDHTLYAHWTGNVPVTIRLAGGTWDGSSEDLVRTVAPGDMVDLEIKKPSDGGIISYYSVFPKRSGCEFAGWMLEHSGSGYYVAEYGRPVHPDPSFKASAGGVQAFNDLENGYVTATRVKRSGDCPTVSDYMTQVFTTGTAKPGLGGFAQSTASKAGGTFRHHIVAKIPKRYRLTAHPDACGDGAQVTWLTPTEGVGEFAFYAYELACGSTGTFSAFGAVSLTETTASDEQASLTPDAPVVWYLAYSQVYDLETKFIEGLPLLPIITKYLTVGDGEATVTALWTKKASVPGDVNEDDALNAKDVTVLRRCIAGGYGVTVDPAKADINHDGTVNAKDVTVLRRCIAGGYGVTLD